MDLAIPTRIRPTYKRMLEALRDKKECRNGNDEVWYSEPYYRVWHWTYYKTNIVSIGPEHIVVKTGGYDTVSTLARLNAFIDSVPMDLPRFHKTKKRLYLGYQLLAGVNEKWEGHARIYPENKHVKTFAV